MQISTGNDYHKNLERMADMRDVHIQEMDDPSEFNPFNRTNN